MSILSIFKKYKKLYDLKTELRFNKRLSEKTGDKAFFCTKNNLIFIKCNLVTSDRLVFLLHEIGHAIQHKKGLLKNYGKSINKTYALEKAAQEFALDEFYKKYTSFGRRTRKSCLASKKRYEIYFNKTHIRNGIQ